MAISGPWRWLGPDRAYCVYGELSGSGDVIDSESLGTAGKSHLLATGDVPRRGV